MSNVVALVPMRAHSERVRDKNLRPLGGVPLFHHILRTLTACDGVDRVVVNTDSERIAEEAEQRFGATVIERPEELRGGHVSMNEIIAHDVGTIEAEIYLQTHTTNPFLRPETVAAAVERFRHRGEHDSLFSVTRVFKRYWTAEGRPVNHDPKRLIRTQDLPPFYEENSNLYLFRRDRVLATGSRIGVRPILFEIDPVEAFDIDDELDFRIAQCLWEQR
jgi:CMP-N-acetylneuraminic acid synthetase